MRLLKYGHLLCIGNPDMTTLLQSHCGVHHPEGLPADAQRHAQPGPPQPNVILRHHARRQDRQQVRNRNQLGIDRESIFCT